MKPKYYVLISMLGMIGAIGSFGYYSIEKQKEERKITLEQKAGALGSLLGTGTFFYGLLKLTNSKEDKDEY